MFPVLPRKTDSELDALRTRLLLSVSSLGKEINPIMRSELSEFMLKINSYYTNAMEGNPSKLKDIENALNQKFSSNRTTRNFQIEHIAHIEVQKKMYEKLQLEPNLEICSQEFLCWLHEQFYLKLPEALRWAITVSGKRGAITPGALRERGARVGGHDAPESRKDIELCLQQFQESLSPVKLKGADQVLALASSHHRLLWIHPFADGNGRVARLFTLAYANRIGVDSDHLWNVTRAFARNRSEYDRHLAAADLPPRNSYDGRGPLSEEELVHFCKFFLESCLDQIEYMKKILESS